MLPLSARILEPGSSLHPNASASGSNPSRRPCASSRRRCPGRRTSARRCRSSPTRCTRHRGGLLAVRPITGQRVRWKSHAAHGLASLGPGTRRRPSQQWRAVRTAVRYLHIRHPFRKAACPSCPLGAFPVVIRHRAGAKDGQVRRHIHDAGVLACLIRDYFCDLYHTPYRIIPDACLCAQYEYGGFIWVDLMAR